MKTAVRIVVPLLAVSVAACGGGNKASSQADVPAMKGVSSPAASSTPAAPASGTSSSKQTNAGKSGAPATHASSGATARQPKLPAKTAPALAALKPGKGPLYPLVVTSAGVSGPVAGQNVIPVRAGSPFVLAFISADKKPHTVTLDKPTTRLIKVVPAQPGRLTFQGLAPGQYKLRVDHAPKVATITAIKPGAKP